ncbi:MAG TPA: BREX system Lon protease-like protein BrxL [Actinomycetaceae bacterium]|nr:BREX system Lon protease-like protein BrxL [Actinomycetaceae bacterium]
MLEYLLGQYAASDDEATIQAGIEAVRKILADHYVHRNESELVKSTIREKGRHRIIDKVTVTLNDKQDVYQASFANLGLSEAYHDSAFLDRLHFYIPGWEVDTIRNEMFSSGYGFVVDYIAEVLRSMRNTDYSDRYQQHFTLGSDISTRDRDGIRKTFSGLMKLIYPSGEATQDEIEELLRFAIEGRKRVKDQILRIDTTMAAVNFGYTDKTGA